MAMTGKEAYSNPIHQSIPYNSMTPEMIDAVLRYRTDAAYEYHLSQKD